MVETGRRRGYFRARPGRAQVSSAGAESRPVSRGVGVRGSGESTSPSRTPDVLAAWPCPLSRGHGRQPGAALRTSQARTRRSRRGRRRPGRLTCDDTPPRVWTIGVVCSRPRGVGRGAVERSRRVSCVVPATRARWTRTRRAVVGPRMPVVGDPSERAVVPFGSKPLRRSDAGPSHHRPFRTEPAEVAAVPSPASGRYTVVTAVCALGRGDDQRTVAGACRPANPVARPDRRSLPRATVPPPIALPASRPADLLFVQTNRAKVRHVPCGVTRTGSSYRTLEQRTHRVRKGSSGGRRRVSDNRVGRGSVIGRAPAVWRLRNA